LVLEWCLADPACPVSSSNSSAYSQYLAFFHKEIERLGTTGALERYIFSEDAVSLVRFDRSPDRQMLTLSSEQNGGGVDNAEGPRMLLRTVAGVLRESSPSLPTHRIATDHALSPIQTL